MSLGLIHSSEALATLCAYSRIFTLASTDQALVINTSPFSLFPPTTGDWAKIIPINSTSVALNRKATNN